MKIWKYPVPIRDAVRVSLPRGAELLCVQVQGEEPCLWALVDPDASSVVRAFRWRGTVQEMEDAQGGVHVGTVQIEGGRLVFHLFDLGERS